MSKDLKFTSLKSSNLDGAHYDEATKTLTVKFKNGGTYAYGGVVKEHFEGLTSAESAGKFFHKTIRGGGYKHSKV